MNRLSQPFQHPGAKERCRHQALEPSNPPLVNISDKHCTGAQEARHLLAIGDFKALRSAMISMKWRSWYLNLQNLDRSAERMMARTTTCLEPQLSLCTLAGSCYSFVMGGFMTARKQMPAQD